jgi:D-alanyl-D-alanine carboxypeptidase
MRLFGYGSRQRRRDTAAGSAAQRTRTSPTVRPATQALSILALVAAACVSSDPETGSSESPTTTGSQPAAMGTGVATGASPPPTYALGEFPDLPHGALSGSVAEALQSALDAEIEAGTFTGITAAVIVADRGSWTGAAGSAHGIALTPDSPTPTHSVGKTVVAAEILRLAEDGRLDIDDLASEHLPPELGWYDANGATIRQLLGMRRGIPNVPGYEELYYTAERAPTPVKVFRMLPASADPPGGAPEYADTNFVLLGTIVEHVTGRPLAKSLRSGVLDDPALDGLVYTVGNALAADGWGVESTPASLARWGYDLYGGSVVSNASLREMTDFQGEWYGLGTMNLSDSSLGVGHTGISSPTTCCSEIVLAALPEEGVVISVQASSRRLGDPFTDVTRLTQLLRDVVT